MALLNCFFRLVAEVPPQKGHLGVVPAAPL